MFNIRDILYSVSTYTKPSTLSLPISLKDGNTYFSNPITVFTNRDDIRFITREDEIFHEVITYNRVFVPRGTIFDMKDNKYIMNIYNIEPFNLLNNSIRDDDDSVYKFKYGKICVERGLLTLIPNKEFQQVIQSKQRRKKHGDLMFEAFNEIDTIFSAQEEPLYVKRNEFSTKPMIINLTGTTTIYEDIIDRLDEMSLF